MPHSRSNRRKTAVRSRRWWSLPVTNWNKFINWNKLINGALVAVSGIAAWSAITWLLEQPINSVRVDGTFERVPAVQIEAAVMPYLREGDLTVGLRELRDVIRGLPWVQDASVRRSWPSTLNIAIIEERAAARWDESGLLNVYGELFVEEAKHIPAELPELKGPRGTELQVAQLYFALNSQLEQRGLNATKLQMDERGSWTLQLSNGMEVRFGSLAIEQRTARFFQALDKVLTPVADKVDYIDMRYTNGFAVGWKPAANMQLASRREIEAHAW